MSKTMRWILGTAGGLGIAVLSWGLFVDLVVNFLIEIEVI